MDPLIEVSGEKFGTELTGYKIARLDAFASQLLHLRVNGLQSMLTAACLPSDGERYFEGHVSCPPQIDPCSVNASVRFVYYGSEQNTTERRYRRCHVLRLNIVIVPAVLLLNWHVLPGESTLTRYIAMDVLNTTGSEVKLEFLETKNVLIQPRDVCRVPVKVNCYELKAAGNKHAVLRGSDGSEVQKKVADHLRAQLNIRWLMSDPPNSGSLNVSSILNSSQVATKFSLPPVSVGYLTRTEGKLSLEFYLDFQNGEKFDISNEVVFVGPLSYLFSLAPAKAFSDYFEFLFCSEGVFHVNFVPEPLSGADELFCQLRCLLLPLTFTVVSKCITLY
ncbi:unnamed protein product [Soboliphyme baturini]|uniref:Trafficking protein particle complex subunit 13 n=1 Tax=Soboliphyme baturini TaxID=241478 RepID=A0A183IPZ2_9BILA|nr:unnamed protein product [Soboliphyme baturini]